jgi:hypothetical protein
MEMSKLTETEKARQVKSKVKGMLIIFLWYQGDCSQIIRPGRPNNQFRILLWRFRRLRENVRRLRPELWLRKKWLLLHDNTTSHISLFNKEIFTKKQHDRCPHPPSFSLFPRLKTIQLRWSRQNYTWRWTPSQNTTSRMQLRNSRSAWNGTCERKGTTSRVKTASRPKISFRPDGSISSRNYG